MIQPIALKNPLKEPPLSAPRWAVPVKNRNGGAAEAADPKALRALVACMDMTAALGGAASHYGGPSAFAELMSALHALMFQEARKAQIPYFEKFHFVNDAGHCENGIYALKAAYGLVQIEDLKLFRSIEGKLAGHGEAHLFPEGVYLSNGPLGSSLGQAQGLSMADRLRGKARLCVSAISDGALMEGEAKEALAAIPGFARKGQTSPFLLIVSDNGVKLSGGISQQSFSMAPTLKSLEALGWKTLSLPQGNDLQSAFSALEEALSEAWENPKRPVALVAKTLKGFGIKTLEESPSGGHGFPLKDPKDLKAFIEEIYQGEALPQDILSWSQEIARKKRRAAAPPSFVKTQAGVGEALVQQKMKGLPLVSISADLQGSTGAGPFRKKFPESSFDVGVAEANMISAAIGFSKAGFIPVADTFAQFAVTKGALPLIMSALSESPVIGIFSHAGFQDAADGASHQALSYIAKTQSLPRTRVCCLSCSDEGFRLVFEAIGDFHQQRKEGRIPPSTLFFLGRELFPPKLPLAAETQSGAAETQSGAAETQSGAAETQSGGGGARCRLNSAEAVFENLNGKSPVLMVSFGPLIHEALDAAKQLQEKGYGAVLINNPTVSDPDIKLAAHWLKKCSGRLLALEEHQLRGGFSSLLALRLKEAGERFSLKALGISGEFGRSAYSANELLARHGLSSKDIQKAALEMSAADPPAS